jgi:hypothetical protein
MANFTPGSWEAFVAPETRTFDVHRKDGSGLIVGWPGFDHDEVTVEEHAANAYLLAAAPDLLAACEMWHEFATERLFPEGDPVAAIAREFHGDRIEATRNAIAKAKGETL